MADPSEKYKRLNTSRSSVRSRRTHSSTQLRTPSEAEKDVPENDVSSTPTTPETYRFISLPRALPNQVAVDEEFCTNVVITSKYTTLNFLPKFVYQSFRKLANAYFLFVSILQTIPMISNTGGVPSTLPVLMFILSVDAILAIVEDRRRHLADYEANSAMCQIVRSTYTENPNKLSQEGKATLPPTNFHPTEDPEIVLLHWSELTVGTIVKLRNRETAPADLLILSVAEPIPSQPSGICYVETKSLDGETNLKLRHAVEPTMSAQSAGQVGNLQGFLRCEQPNRVIGRFDGLLTMSSLSSPSDLVQEPVLIKNVLLRGCQLRNTEWIYGIVINTGPDTKIMQSSATVPVKWSSINESVNRMVVWLLVLLLLCCMVASTLQLIWLEMHGSILNGYLNWRPEFISQWFIGFGYYFLLLYQMIPVSLYVTISVVMFLQAIFMTMDLDMFYEPLNTKMIVRSMGLNEELGQISYIFTDKTGTLTCNVMEFRKCCINGISYGTGTTEIGRAALRRKGIPTAEPDLKPSDSRKMPPYVNFEDPRLLTRLNRSESSSNSSELYEGSLEAAFFLHLSLCHTVIPETVEGTDQIRLSASSPDEQALVSGAKFFGYVFESRGLGSARVRVRNRNMTNSMDSKSLEFQILDILEFSSERKRMSIVVKYPSNELWLLTKGADNMIFPLLSSRNDPQMLRDTMSHLEAYAEDGLRTLTIARKRLDSKMYTEWSEKYRLANSNLEEIRKRKVGEKNAIDELMIELEKELILLGATAIEDKLQLHVPRAIANLMRAGIKVWMLTGDKQETAINISYACQLMDNSMKQFVFNCELFPAIEQVGAELTRILSRPRGKARQAVVIDGECLEITLLDPVCRMQFLQLAMSSDAVVCCRVSPSQKAEMVSLLREACPKARTLAIGDGANDVAMIQRAHVGVGICGQEGMQAVNSSDYAIAQFSFLEKLLLHHGRLNYKRMSVLVGYMFYKNILMVLAQFYYTFYSGASGQKFYSEFYFQLYNAMYTTLPILVLGVFDMDVPWTISRQFPELYLVGPRMELFNNITFFKWMAGAMYESAVICSMSLFVFSDAIGAVGNAAMVQYGLVTFSMVVLVVNLKLCFVQMSWSAPWLVCWCAGVLAYLPVSTYVSSLWPAFLPNDFGIFENTMAHPMYWLVMLIGCISSLLRHGAWLAFQRMCHPFPWQVVQEAYVLHGDAGIIDMGSGNTGNGGFGVSSTGRSHGNTGNWDDRNRAPSAVVGFAAGVDLEAGIPVVGCGNLSSQEDTNYYNASPMERVERRPGGLSGTQSGSSAETAGESARTTSTSSLVHRRSSIKKEGNSSGFAFSFDPMTSAAESFMSLHSVRSVASALSDAEQRVSWEDQRSSNYEGRKSELGRMCSEERIAKEKIRMDKVEEKPIGCFV
uniref:Phospholipid-transporting ATPase n=1 Tax=Albugo laibachii Nc14 TaxID=890382 RepID=F0WPS0_9STRA|nr:PREDICTED: probable phospholipidtransporting ATPase IBlike putative [Albugo laibachii Nc14]CCA24343.1 PREDICTED: hypothetical protein [Albugo laibachii Nc14]|eukprot:CCA24343.1 PREDICTED: hypothetical protein [Albugo laibachii Nc14]